MKSKKKKVGQFYNYFEDVNPDFMREEFLLEERKDPDFYSRKLRNDFLEAFLSNLSGHEVAPEEEYNSFYLINKESGEQEFILSLDYIGPSIYQAGDIAGLSEAEIKEFLQISRTLGGHLVWERGKDTLPTVNWLRGGQIMPGCGYGFYDRTDWTLLLLKIYLETGSEEGYEKKILTLLKEDYPDLPVSEEDKHCFGELRAAFLRSPWLSTFSDFKEFCDLFQLKGSFVDEAYKIVEFADLLPIKPTREGYRRYIKNNIEAIERRNEILGGA